jgi:hypothetical protein
MRTVSDILAFCFAYQAPSHHRSSPKHPVTNTPVTDATGFDATVTDSQ